jgi:IstB-like ATP binding protein
LPGPGRASHDVSRQSTPLSSRPDSRPPGPSCAVCVDAAGGQLGDVRGLVAWRSPAGSGSQLLFRFVAAAYERRSLAIASPWPFDKWGRSLPKHSTAVSLLDRLLHHNNVVATDGEGYRMREARSRSGARPSKR